MRTRTRTGAVALTLAGTALLVATGCGTAEPPTASAPPAAEEPTPATSNDGPITRRSGTSSTPSAQTALSAPTPSTAVAPTSTTPTPTSQPGLLTAGPPSSRPVGDRFVDPSLTWGQDATPPSSAWVRPPLGRFGFDEVYGTPVRRLTSADGTRFDRNTYSRRQAENADGSNILTYHGSASYRVYEAERGGLVAELDLHPDAEPQWHPTDPGRIRHLIGPNSSVGGLQLLETTVASGETTVIADLTSRIQATVPNASYFKDRAEGSPSGDGNRYAWILHDDSEQPIGLVSYDLATDHILGITTDLVDDRIDWVSASVTGRYVVAGHAAGTFVYDADLGNRRLVTAALEHSDLALAADGTDRYVYIDFTSNPDTGGWLTSVDLATLDRVTIFDAFDQANTSMHISGKGYEKPGWVVVSTYNCKVPGAWTCEKVMAVELVANGRVLNLAHTYNCGDNYWTETHAVVNRAFTRIYFNSDAGSCGIDAEVYRLDVPAFP